MHYHIPYVTDFSTVNWNETRATVLTEYWKLLSFLTCRQNLQFYVLTLLRRSASPLFGSNPFPRHKLSHSISMATTWAHLLNHRGTVTPCSCHKASLILASSLSKLLEYQNAYGIQGFFELWQDQLLDIDFKLCIPQHFNLIEVPLVYY